MKKRFTDEQMIGVLKEAEAGMMVAELCRKYGISDATYYNWKAKRGMGNQSQAYVLHLSRSGPDGAPAQTQADRWRRASSESASSQAESKLVNGFRFRRVGGRPPVAVFEYRRRLHQRVPGDRSRYIVARAQSGEWLERLAEIRGLPQSVTVDNALEFAGKALDEYVRNTMTNGHIVRSAI